MPKAIIKFAGKDKGKIKSVRQFTWKHNHNMRTVNVKNADAARKDQNRELITLPEGKSIVEAYKDRLDEGCPYYKTHKMHSQAVLGFECILGIGAGKLPETFDLDAWCEGNIQWLKDRFGEKNVISAVLHMDESTPHIHAIIVPVNEETGRLSCREMIGGPPGMREIQESYSKSMQAYGLDPRTPYSAPERKTLDELYNTVNEAVSYSLPEIEDGEDIDHFMDRARTAYRRMNLKNVTEKKKLRDTIAELESKQLQSNKKISSLITELQEYEALCDGNIEQLKRRLEFLNRIEMALENHPNPELIESSKELIGELVKFAKEKEYEELMISEEELAELEKELNNPDIED